MSEASLNTLYEALGTPLGVVVQTDNPEKLRAKLYRLRDGADDPMLKELSIVISPTMPQSQVWIVKRKPNAP
jgi:hypothetical protein